MAVVLDSSEKSHYHEPAERRSHRIASAEGSAGPRPAGAGRPCAQMANRRVFLCMREMQACDVFALELYMAAPPLADSGNDAMTKRVLLELALLLPDRISEASTF